MVLTCVTTWFVTWWHSAWATTVGDHHTGAWNVAHHSTTAVASTTTLWALKKRKEREREGESGGRNCVLWSHDFKTIQYTVMTQTLIIGHMCCSTCTWKYFPPSLPAPFPPSTHWSPSKGSPSRGCETRPGALSGRGWLRLGTFAVWEDTVVTVTPAHHTPRLGTLIAIVGLTLQEQRPVHCVSGPSFHTQCTSILTFEFEFASA